MLDCPHILITGHLGYVGGVLVPWLRQELPGARLTGCDIGWFAAARTSKGRAPEAELDRQLECDVRDLGARELRSIDGIVHLAAVSNDPIGKAFEAATFAINRDATIALAERARAAGVRRFVFASSCSVYGAAAEDRIDERGPVAPLSAYARSKLEAELALRSLASEDFRVSALRFGTACGFSPRLRLDLVLNDFVANVLVRGGIELLSTGEAWRPLVHVQDMARALEWALCRQGAAFECVNVGSEPMTLRVRALAERVAAAVPGARVTVRNGAVPDTRSYRVDFARYRALAPWHQPRVDVDAAILDLLAGLQRIGFADPEFRSGPLIRLEAVRTLQRGGGLDPLLRRTEFVHGR